MTKVIKREYVSDVTACTVVEGIESIIDVYGEDELVCVAHILPKGNIDYLTVDKANKVLNYCKQNQLSNQVKKFELAYVKIGYFTKCAEVVVYFK